MYEILQSVYGYRVDWEQPIAQTIHQYILANPTEFDWWENNYTDDDCSYEELFLETYAESLYDGSCPTPYYIGEAKRSIPCWQADTKTLKEMLNQKIKPKDIEGFNNKLGKLPENLQSLLSSELGEPILEIIPHTS